VHVFFAISGFLITTRLLAVRASGEHNHVLREFYIRRACRILPPYLLYLCVLGLIAASGVVRVSRIEWIGCLTFFRNYIPEPDLRGWYTEHFWSLSVEEHFYLLWPVLLVLSGDRRARLAAVILALAVPIWGAIDAKFVIVSCWGMGRTDHCVDALFWSAFAAMIFNDPRRRLVIDRWLTMRLWTAVVAVLAAVLVFDPPMGFTLQSFLMPWMLVGTVIHGQTWIARFLEFQWPRAIGRVSYGLYLWQQLFFSGSGKGLESYHQERRGTGRCFSGVAPPQRRPASVTTSWSSRSCGLDIDLRGNPPDG